MSAKKIGGNTAKILSCYFQDEFILSHIRLNVFKWKTNFSFHKHYLFGLHFSRSAKKPHTDQIILPTFLLCLKRDVSQTLNSSSYKEVFPKCVYHGCNLLRWFFLFRVIIGRHSFLYKLTVTQKFGWTTLLLRSLKQVFWKTPVFPYLYPLSPQ